jgi:uncharacterized protein
VPSVVTNNQDKKLYLYLHGFASGANSRKAIFLQEHFAQQGQNLLVPDFNEGGFTDFTITRELQQAASYFSTEPVTLIGSSLGGWAALLLAQKYPQVERLILLAPALGFPQPWLSRLGSSTLQKWQETGTWPIYHYIEKREIPLSYRFVSDAQQYLDRSLTRQLPTLIFHGIQDAVVPIELSQHYAANRSEVQLQELASDHSLGNVLPQIWQGIASFCGL